MQTEIQIKYIDPEIAQFPLLRFASKILLYHENFLSIYGSSSIMLLRWGSSFSTWLVFVLFLNLFLVIFQLFFVFFLGLLKLFLSAAAARGRSFLLCLFEFFSCLFQRLPS